MTQIDIISGFLGAGKTTLIKKLLKEAFQGQKTVLIENEFGEIGIDGGFLKEAGVEITEMNSGCICCSLVGDFRTALKEVLDRFTPDRIIIEPSGVGKLSDVIKAVEDVTAHLHIQLNSAVTVVDAKKCRMYMKNFGEFFNNQIEHAGTIVLSRTQNVSEEKLQACVEELQKHNPKATLITTPWDDISGSTILAAFEHQELDMEEHHHEHEENCTCGCHDHDHEHHHHADEVFTSFGAETVHKYGEEELRRMLEDLNSGAYGTILRAKGILAGTDGQWIQFDFVPEEFEIRKGNPDYTGRLCVIGAELKEDQLKELFAL